MHVIKNHPVSNIRKEICIDWPTSVSLYIYIKTIMYCTTRIQRNYKIMVGVLFFASYEIDLEEPTYATWAILAWCCGLEANGLPCHHAVSS